MAERGRRELEEGVRGEDNRGYRKRMRRRTSEEGGEMVLREKWEEGVEDKERNEEK